MSLLKLVALSLVVRSSAGGEKRTEGSADETSSGGFKSYFAEPYDSAKHKIPLELENECVAVLKIWDGAVEDVWDHMAFRKMFRILFWNAVPKVEEGKSATENTESPSDGEDGKGGNKENKCLFRRIFVAAMRNRDVRFYPLVYVARKNKAKGGKVDKKKTSVQDKGSVEARAYVFVHRAKVLFVACLLFLVLICCCCCCCPSCLCSYLCCCCCRSTVMVPGVLMNTATVPDFDDSIEMRAA